MNYLLDKNYDETLSINFLGIEEFSPGDKLVLTMPVCEKGITNITSYSDIVEGETSNVYLRKYFQYRNGSDDQWSEPESIEKISEVDVCSRKCLQFKLLYYRMDDGGHDSSITITLRNPSINGEYKFTTSDSQLVLNSDDPIQILQVSDVLKIFEITDYEVISTARYGNAFNIKYRFSQDDKRTWTKWEPLSEANITTAKWDKLRFVNLEYMFEMTEGYTTPVKIYDVILYGDFQNVSANSMKINLFGLKQNCINIYNKPSQIGEETSGINETISAKDIDSTTTSLIKETSEYQLRMNFLTQGLNCYSNPQYVEGGTTIDQLNNHNDQNQNSFWNPYEFGKITDWHEFLAGTINDMLGFTIDYHRTDPDAGGIDRVIHEYQLHNIVDVKSMKVLVPENQFPDNQVVINQFNLDLFDTFKINILKTEFKEAFGVQFRPGQEDILYFCQTNRMYIVKHAQVHKDVMHSGIYYDVVLEKYEKRSNVLNRVEESKTKIENLTKNTTIDELFGFDQYQEQEKISNKNQMKPKTFDYIRDSINPRIVFDNTELYNGSIKVMEGSYYLENITNEENAVVYVERDNNLLESDNRTFSFWANFPNLYDPDRSISKDVILSYDIPENVIYNVIDNMNDSNIGYKVWYQNDSLWVMVNDDVHKIPMPLMTDIWYAFIISLDQRQRKLSVKLYRRNTRIEVVLYHPSTYERIELDLEEDTNDIEYEMNVNGFRAVDNIEIGSTDSSSVFIEMDSYQKEIEPLSFNHDESISIKGSKMYLSNIRVLNDIMDEDYHQSYLNELIVRNAQNVIVADNSEKQIKSENIPNKNWR